MFKILVKAAFLSLIVLSICCSENSFSVSEASSERGKELQKLIKDENFLQIYRQSSSCMRSNYSENEFINVVRSG
jgi:hypothetical protein